MGVALLQGDCWGLGVVSISLQKGDPQVMATSYWSRVVLKAFVQETFYVVVLCCAATFGIYLVTQNQDHF